MPSSDDTVVWVLSKQARAPGAPAGPWVLGSGMRAEAEAEAEAWA
jgi:hypothetical protein